MASCSTTHTSILKLKDKSLSNASSAGVSEKDLPVNTVQNNIKPVQLSRKIGSHDTHKNKNLVDTDVTESGHIQDNVHMTNKSSRVLRVKKKMEKSEHKKCNCCHFQFGQKGPKKKAAFVAKRRVGRPCKKKTHALVKENKNMPCILYPVKTLNYNEVFVSRKRGRPRKNLIIHETETVTTSSTEKVALVAEEDLKVAQCSVTENNSKTDTITNEPRKRGRPRKSLNINETKKVTTSGDEVAHVADDSLDVTKKAQCVENNFDTDTVINEPRKGSRPHRSQNINETETVTPSGDEVAHVDDDSLDVNKAAQCMEDNSDADTATNGPRKRGRPRKSLNLNEIETLTTSGDEVPHVNDSPVLSKSACSKENNSDTDIVTNGPRKRGRPSRSLSTIETETKGLSSSINKELSEVDLDSGLSVTNMTRCNITSDIKNICDSDVITDMPRKRGRPRKSLNICTTGTVADSIACAADEKSLVAVTSMEVTDTSHCYIVSNDTGISHKEIDLLQTRGRPQKIVTQKIHTPEKAAVFETVIDTAGITRGNARDINVPTLGDKEACAKNNADAPCASVLVKNEVSGGLATKSVLDVGKRVSKPSFKATLLSSSLGKLRQNKREVPLVAKRRVGRPSKKKSYHLLKSDKDIPCESQIESSREGNGFLQTLQNKDYVQSPLKRGRPPKTFKIEINTDGKEGVSVQKDNSLTSQSDKVKPSKPKVAFVVKRSVGRPRKSKFNVAQNRSEKRTSYSDIHLNESAVNKLENSASRKRGRPRKQLFEMVSKLNSTEKYNELILANVKRGRGRPPKITKEDVSSSLEIKNRDEDFTKDMNNMNSDGFADKVPQKSYIIEEHSYNTEPSKNTSLKRRNVFDLFSEDSNKIKKAKPEHFSSDSVKLEGGENSEITENSDIIGISQVKSDKILNEASPGSVNKMKEIVADTSTVISVKDVELRIPITKVLGNAETYSVVKEPFGFKSKHGRPLRSSSKLVRKYVFQPKKLFHIHRNFCNAKIFEKCQWINQKKCTKHEHFQVANDMLMQQERRNAQGIQHTRRGRPRIHPLKLNERRPRGRPRIHPIKEITEKRPRGRPRIHPRQPVNQIRRPVGRPRKERPEDSFSSFMQFPTGSPIKHTEQFRSISTYCEMNYGTVYNHVDELVKRGRGRPRKDEERFEVPWTHCNQAKNRPKNKIKLPAISIFSVSGDEGVKFNEVPCQDDYTHQKAKFTKALNLIPVLSESQFFTQSGVMIPVFSGDCSSTKRNNQGDLPLMFMSDNHSEDAMKKVVSQLSGIFQKNSRSSVKTQKDINYTGTLM